MKNSLRALCSMPLGCGVVVTSPIRSHSLGRSCHSLNLSAEVANNYLNRKVLLHEIYREMYPHDKNQRLMADTCWGTLGIFINTMSKNGSLAEPFRPSIFILLIIF